MARRVKYMGTADVRDIAKGWDFGGQFPSGLSKELVFDASNKWLVDLEEAGVEDADVVAQLLVDNGDFKDVTELKRVPTNAHQQTYLGMPKSVEAEDEPEQSSGTSDSVPSPAGGGGPGLSDTSTVSTTAGRPRGGTRPSST